MRIAVLLCALVCGSTRAGAAGETTVAVLSTRGTRTEVQMAAIERDGARARLGKARRLGSAVEHAADGVVRGAVVDATTALVTAEEEVGPDRSWSGALWRVGARSSERLLGGLAYASRPVVVGRKVYLQTGRAGVAGRELREDEVEITELDLDVRLDGRVDGRMGRASTRVVFAMRGQLAYPIDVAGGELFAYLVGPPSSLGAEGKLVAIGLGDEAPREIATVGVARDFELRDGRIVYTAREGRVRAVFAVDVVSGRRERVQQLGEEGLAGLEVRRATLGEVSLVQRHAAGRLPQLIIEVHGHGAFGDLLWPASDGERIEPMGLR